MITPTIFPIGITESCQYAAHFLKHAHINLLDHISPDITHLLLDIPSFDENRNLRDGSSLPELLSKLPESITVIGGKLNHPSLEQYPQIDLLANSLFQAKNASITAECALHVAASHLTTTISDSPAAILGWGRIGKCLAKLLKTMNCDVTVAVRNERDRAILNALGYRALDFHEISQQLSRFKILFNTVPQQTIDACILNKWHTGIKIDLASYPGLVCENIIVARGLPSKYAPETTGKLIAESILNTIKEVAP